MTEKYSAADINRLVDSEITECLDSDTRPTIDDLAIIDQLLTELGIGKNELVVDALTTTIHPEGLMKMAVNIGFHAKLTTNEVADLVRLALGE